MSQGNMKNQLQLFTSLILVSILFACSTYSIPVAQKKAQEQTKEISPSQIVEYKKINANEFLVVVAVDLFYSACFSLQPRH